jgi:hypothetical protein
MTAFMVALAQVVFGLAPILTALAKALFPQQADKADAADKVIAAIHPIVQKLEETYPADGLGAAKKAVAFGEAAKIALAEAAALSTGGQKDFLDRILPAASSTIDGLVIATNQVVAAGSNFKDNPVTQQG